MARKSIGKAEIAARAYAYYEQRGKVPGGMRRIGCGPNASWQRRTTNRAGNRERWRPITMDRRPSRCLGRTVPRPGVVVNAVPARLDLRGA